MGKEITFKLYTPGYFNRREKGVIKQAKNRSTSRAEQELDKMQKVNEELQKKVYALQEEVIRYKNESDQVSSTFLDKYYEVRCLRDWCVSTAYMLSGILWFSDVLKYAINLHFGSVPFEIFDRYMFKQPDVKRRESTRYSKAEDGTELPNRFVKYTFDKTRNYDIQMPNLAVPGYSRKIWIDANGIRKRAEFYKLSFRIDAGYDRVWCEFLYILQFQPTPNGPWFVYG